MIPQIRNRPLLYFGDISDVRTQLRGMGHFDGVKPMAWWKAVLVTFWIPAIIVHELTHYLTARLLGIPVTGVVLFQFAEVYVGVNVIPKEALESKIVREPFLASPLFVCGPLGVYTLSWAFSSSAPSQALLGILVASGFIYCAIPDQLRDSWFRRHEDN